MKHFVIPDPHARPGASLERFDHAGRMIVDEKPDVVICLGDFADMESLSSYDKGKKSFEGRRFTLDVDATVEAQERLLGPLNAYNAKRRMYKEKLYQPRLIMLGGNHDEGRISRVCNDSPELDGLVSLDLLRYRDFGWDYVPYKVPIEVDGIMYCHHFANGIRGTPISGDNTGRMLLNKNHMSSTVGHSHLWNDAMAVRADGRRMWGVSAGCYWDEVPNFAMDSAKYWWRGLLIKENVDDGDYDLRRISIEQVRRLYA